MFDSWSKVKEKIYNKIRCIICYWNFLFSLNDRHIIEIEVIGPYNEQLKQYFHVLTIRSNPALLGHVTGIFFY